MKALGPLPLWGGSTWNLWQTREGLNKPYWSNGNGIFKSIAAPALEASQFFMKAWQLPLWEKVSSTQPLKAKTLAQWRP